MGDKTICQKNFEKIIVVDLATLEFMSSQWISLHCRMVVLKVWNPNCYPTFAKELSNS
jgi:hypothetical protein